MINRHDRLILRDLAKQAAEIAALPLMAERIAEWKRHNSLRPGRPMILVFPEGAWCEILPDSALQCEEETARRIEMQLRQWYIYAYEHFDSDNVVTGDWTVSKVVHNSGWGLYAKHHDSTEARGSWGFEPVINEPDDLKKLKFPVISYDAEATEEHLNGARELFGDILEVKLKGVSHVSFHLMGMYTQLRGLQETMLDMYENPEMLHEAMAYLEEGNRQVVQQYIDLNLLSLNNDNTYHSSGGNGFTDELPKPDYNPHRIRPCDMWASAEAQEMALVSPEQHEEFILQYERRLMEPFGLNGYGCCEDLTRKLDYVLTIPNIRRISIAPWADVDICAEKLQNKAIFSWKPNPSYIAEAFNIDFLRGYISHTLDAAKNCRLEMILKDTHTCDGHPERFDQWTKLARQLVEEKCG